MDAVAPNARRVQMFLAERALDVAVHRVDSDAGEQKSAAFLAKNPLGQVPVLEDATGRTLSESMAICRFLDDCAEGPRPIRRKSETAR